jgi:hypothetical protein
MTYIGYHIDDFGDGAGKGTPVAIGDDYDTVQAQTIRRVLSLGITSGSMQVQKKEGLTAADVDKIRETLDAWFAEKGIVV